MWIKGKMVTFLLFSTFALFFNFVENHLANFNVADVELTITVKAGKRDCFYQYAKKDQTLKFEYRVVDASFGDHFGAAKELSISFFVYSSRGHEIFSDVQKKDAVHKYEVYEEGDYEICFDNGFSTFSSKTVYFEVFVDVSTEEYRWENLNKVFESEKYTNDSISHLKKVVNKVKDDLNRVKHFQDTFRAVEARDINIQEKNFVKVNTFSSLTTVIMMLFGAVHLFVLKSMFMENSKLWRVFKRF